MCNNKRNVDNKGEQKRIIKDKNLQDAVKDGSKHLHINVDTDVG